MCIDYVISILKFSPHLISLAMKTYVSHREVWNLNFDKTSSMICLTDYDSSWHDYHNTELRHVLAKQSAYSL